MPINIHRSERNKKIYMNKSKSRFFFFFLPVDKILGRELNGKVLYCNDRYVSIHS